MIYTVTLNPALDRLIVVDQLVADETIRILSETFDDAGKGIDASRVIRELGGQSVALGFVGCIRFAAAAGTATAQTPGTELCHHMDVDKILSRVQLSTVNIN